MSIRDDIRQRVLERIMEDDDFMNNVSDRVIENVDYNDIADQLNITASDLVDHIDEDELRDKVVEGLDLCDLANSIEINTDDLAEKLSKRIVDELVKDIVEGNI